MVKLNDYLYDGNTLLTILRQYADDLRAHGRENNNPVDVLHANVLYKMEDVLLHNEFLASQSERIREYYDYMAEAYPYLAFTFKGRIKSLLRSEEKFNGYLVDYACDYYKQKGTFPDITEIKARMQLLRDLVAYRIVISLPKTREPDAGQRAALELQYLYEIANTLPDFLEDRGFTAELAGRGPLLTEGALRPAVRPYYRDYVAHPKKSGYRSLHIVFYDNLTRCHAELQMRTKTMDDFAEIGPGNHISYEQRQQTQRERRASVPVGACQWFDDACERLHALQTIDYSRVDVNMFSAMDNYFVNDACGLLRGRLIRPFEHLSRGE